LARQHLQRCLPVWTSLWFYEKDIDSSVFKARTGLWARWSSGRRPPPWQGAATRWFIRCLPTQTILFYLFTLSWLWFLFKFRSLLCPCCSGCSRSSEEVRTRTGRGTCQWTEEGCYFCSWIWISALFAIPVSACAVWCNLGGLLELRLYRQAATSASHLFTVFLQCYSEYSLKYCFWSVKRFLVCFLFLRKTCCTFSFYCKDQLESRSLSLINWGWFLSPSPARPNLVDIQSCKTLLIQFFLRVFWSGHVRWSVILLVFVKSVLLMLRVDGLVLFTTRVSGGWLTGSLQEHKKCSF